MMLETAVSLIFPVALMNVLTFVLWGSDKSAAREGRWRVPERALLGAAFLGGWLGAKLGQRFFRHKTRKEPFRSLLNYIPVGWLVLAGLWYFAPEMLEARLR